MFNTTLFPGSNNTFTDYNDENDTDIDRFLRRALDACFNNFDVILKSP